MGRNYTDEDLATAVSPVQERGISVRVVQKTYGAVFNTIRRRVNGYVDTDCKRPGPLHNYCPKKNDAKR
jgi:hypothetical protein